jgi:hypothetical protein
MALPNAEKLTSQMAMLPDAALKQMAMMHKNDPYVLPLIISEDGRRKQMRQAAQAQMGGMPQPKVADAALAQMGQLPEEQGIGMLPAPNMQRMADGGIAGYGDGDDVPRQNGMAQGGMYDFAQRSEPVVRMAEGGILGFKKGGLTDKQEFAMQYKDIADKVGKELGVDPGILISQWGLETAWGKKTVGQYNLGNIKDVSGKGPKAYDKMEKSRDSYKTYDSPDAFAADYAALIKRNFPKAVGAGSDIGAFSAGLQSGEKGAYATDPNYRKVLANTYKNLPMGAAVAEEVPGAKKASVDTSLASQIPGQNVQAPASTYDQTNSIFGRAADKLGIPLEAQRQIGTTLNAPTPLAPVVGSAKSGSGIVALGEKVADKLGLLKGPAGSMSKAEIAALQKESSGLKALENSQLAMKDAQSAGATLDEQEYLRKMMETRRAAEAPSKAAQIAEASQLREAGDVATAQRLAQTGERAQTAGRVDALADRTLPANTAAPVAGVADGAIPFKGIDDNELKRMQEANQAPMTRDDLVEAAKEATPAKERKGFSNDDLLTLGLSLLASKSPNFMTALGEAGLATVAGKKEREKTEREEAKSKGAEELQRAQAKYYGAYAGAIERGAKEKNDELQAEKAITDYMANWDKSMANKTASMSDSTLRARAENEYRQRIYAQMGITPIMSKQAAPAASGGFKFVGVN